GSVRTWVEALGRLYYLFEIRPYAGRLARALRREAKVYLFDFSEIADPGARFENLVALHLLKLRDAWNDWGLGDFELHYVRDKEKREVDFLLTESRRPYLLLEAKLSAQAMEETLPALVLLLGPFAPYAAEEMWERLGRQGPVLRVPWPQYDQALAAEEQA
ncbi:MAG: DUF4143 domain-containing protein, partial [Elusimicrobiota bacterium]